jgi:plasmid stabilization system protein ParE
MTPRAQWTPEAEADVEEIVYYIAVKDGRPLVAEQLANGILEACERYALHPLIGEIEPRLGPECRRFTFKRWIVLYRPWNNGIAILRVVDSARDFDRLFDQP